MSRAFQNWVHRKLGGTTVFSKLAVKVRNQANCVIAARMGAPDSIEDGGEAQLVKRIAPHVKTFIDVGANVGDWSHQMLKGGAEGGYCVEPSAQCVERLRERFRDSKVETLHMALSDRPGTASFFEEDDFGKKSSLGGRAGKQDGKTREVKVSTLDEQFADKPARVDYLKTDCEGWDMRALKGGEALLKRTRFVQFEYNAFWLSAGSSLKEAISFLEGYGFKLFLIKDSGLHPLNYSFWGDFFRYANFLACREEDLDPVRALIGEVI